MPPLRPWIVAVVAVFVTAPSLAQQPTPQQLQEILQQVQQRLEVARHKRIDEEIAPGSSYLNETKPGYEPLFSHKFRVEAQPLYRSIAFVKLLERLFVFDQLKGSCIR